MAKFPPVDLTVFLDDGGVLNDTERQDECLEVTPAAVRLRKTEMVAHVRARQRSRARK